MRSSCTASGPANPRYGDRTRDLHGFSAAVLQHTSSGPLWQSRCALRSTVPAHAGCPHTVPAHNGPSLPCTSRLQCRCILHCKGARTRALSSRPPRGFLGARARSFSCTQAAARGSACPHPGPLQLRLLVLLKLLFCAPSSIGNFFSHWQLVLQPIAKVMAATTECMHVCLKA